MNLVLAGPPGSGKSTIGALVARAMRREFVDGDRLLEARWGRPIPDYFGAGDEPLFRAREAEICRSLAERDDLVVAVGGGALLNPHSRAALERSGVLICLQAPFEALLSRVEQSGPIRPLVAGNGRDRLAALLHDREAHYASFPLRVDTGSTEVASAVDVVLTHYKRFHGITMLKVGPTAAVYSRGLLPKIAELLSVSGLRAPAIVLADAQVVDTHGAAVGHALNAPVSPVPTGEANKTLDTVQSLLRACLAHGLDRASSIAAVGGGVTGDVVGFVAATYMRGVRWANVPTTVLAMADSALGGKVGVDLPEGKNLVGAFHPPVAVVADFDVLHSLPPVEVRCGLAEIIKSGIIRDPILFDGLNRGQLSLEDGIQRAAAVKTGIVNADPLEHGERASLNLGHTIGHGIEAASGYGLKHGEAVAIGLAAETRLAEVLGLVETGLTEGVTACLVRAGLPVRCPGLDADTVRHLMNSDKKKSGGKLRFALPRRIGDVVWGIEAEEAALTEVLREITHADD